MKKLLMTIIATLCLAVTVNAQTVFISQGDGAVAYHKSKSCSYLSNSKQVKSVTTAEAKKLGRHECPRCYGTAAVKKTATTTKKAAEKKATTTKKAAEKEVKKTSTQARDEKGRFIKKTDDAKKTTVKKATTTKKAAEKKVDDAKKKATPARDEKGRFIKKAA